MNKIISLIGLMFMICGCNPKEPDDAGPATVDLREMAIDQIAMAEFSIEKCTEDIEVCISATARMCCDCLESVKCTPTSDKCYMRLVTANELEFYTWCPINDVCRSECWFVSYDPQDY